MSVLTVRTSQGIKLVRIAGDEPTQDELATIYAAYETGQPEQAPVDEQGPVGAQGPAGPPGITEVEQPPQMYMPDAGGPQSREMGLFPVEEPAPLVDNIPELKPGTRTTQAQREELERHHAYLDKKEAEAPLGTIASAMFRHRPPNAPERQMLASPFEWLPADITTGSVKGGLQVIKTAAALSDEALQSFGFPENKEFALNLERWLKEAPSPAGVVEPRSKLPGELMREERIEESASREFPGLINTAGTVAYSVAREPGVVTESLAQFAVPYMAAKSTGAPSPVASFVAGASGFDTQSKRMSNFINELKPYGYDLTNPVTEYLEYKPGADSLLEGAFKNGIEMGLLDAGMVMFFRSGLRAHRASKQALKRGQDPEEVLARLRRDPNYDKTLELHATKNFLDDTKFAPEKPPPLPKHNKHERHYVGGGTKVTKEVMKETDDVHASQYSKEREELITKWRESRQKAPRNRQKGAITLPDSFQDTPIHALGEKVDHFVRPLSSRIRAAHPKLGPRVATLLDRFELDQMVFATNAYKRQEPLLKSISRMKSADKKLWNAAYKEQDKAALFDIARRYENGVSGLDPAGGSLRQIKINNFQHQLKESFKGFEVMHQTGVLNGIKMGKIQDYLPLKVKNWKALRKEIGRTDDRFEALIERELKAHARETVSKGNLQSTNAPSNYQYPQTNAQGQGYDFSQIKINYATGEVSYFGRNEPLLQLTDLQKNKIAQNFMQGSKQGGPYWTKERGEVTMTPQIQKHYYDFDEVISQYPNNWAFEVAQNRFLGKVPGRESMGWQNQVAEMVNRGNIKNPEAMRTISELVEVRLNAGRNANISKEGAKKFWDNTSKGYRDFVYISTLGNPYSTITQMSEWGLNAFRNGFFNNLTGTKTAVLDNLPKFMQRAFSHNTPGVRMKDLGLSELGVEFSSAGRGPISNTMNKLLNGGQIKGVKVPGAMDLVGFKKMDYIMKESNLNGALKKAKKQLSTQAGEQAFRQRMQPFYQGETDALVQSLKTGNPNAINDDLTRLYLFQELAKTQPIALSEMPAAYLNAGGFGKSFYFLKSFGLKQLETARRDIIRKLGKPGEMGEGFYNLASLGLFFGGGTVGTSMLKDYLMGRDTEASEYLFDSLLQLAGQSRYQVNLFKGATTFRDYAESGLWMIAPPHPYIKEIGQDDYLRKTQKYWPLIGKYLSWTSGYPFGHRTGYSKEQYDKYQNRGGGGIPEPPTAPPPGDSIPVPPQASADLPFEYQNL